MLTLDDFELGGKTAFLRVDINCPMDASTGQIAGTGRIEEIAGTLEALAGARTVIASHQGRVGNADYTGMASHARAMERITGRKILYVEDVIGQSARDAVRSLADGDVLLLDNLRLCAEENYEFAPEQAAQTVMVRRLAGLFDLCVMDSFPTAHRSHPTLVGMPRVLPACAGRLVEREVRELDRIMSVAKAPHVIVLGGSKIRDRLEALTHLIASGRADHVLLTGLIGNVFLRAQGRIRYPLGIADEDDLVASAHALIGEHPGSFSTPVDVAVDRDGRRVELDVRDLSDGDAVADLGPNTVAHYSRYISGAGTVFMSGPPGRFEDAGFSYGTEELLGALARSVSTSIVSGGHLTSALKRYGLAGSISHTSTAGGALVRYLTGERLPMLRALDEAEARMRG